jgi:hypothetical protein
MEGRRYQGKVKERIDQVRKHNLNARPQHIGTWWWRVYFSWVCTVPMLPVPLIQPKYDTIKDVDEKINPKPGRLRYCISFLSGYQVTIN